MDELSGKQASSSVLERKKMQVSELVFEKFTMTEEISICKDLSPSLSSIVFTLSHSYFEMLAPVCDTVFGEEY